MSGDRVVAFELLPRIAMDFTVKHIGITIPLAEFSPWYAMSELADPGAGSFEVILEEAMARGLVTDATVAQSETQRQALWAIRELMPESQKFEGGSIKHDVSVPVSRIPQFIVEATRAVEDLHAGGEGHVLRPHGRRQFAFQCFAAPWHGQGKVS